MLVLTAAIVFECTRLEWVLLLLCIGFVLTTELLNSAIETLFHGLEPRAKERGCRALDIAAGAVLMASLTAAAVGIMIFWPRVEWLMGWK